MLEDECDEDIFVTIFISSIQATDFIRVRLMLQFKALLN